MFLFSVNDNVQINLENIDAIKLVKAKKRIDLAAVINGITYFVDQKRHKEFLSAIANQEKNSNLTQQYLSV